MARKILQSGYLNNPWTAFLPFLLLYALVIWVLRARALDGDAGTYLNYAYNLLAGHYSPKDHVHLWTGPGYSLLITPLVAIGAPDLVLIMLNAGLRYLSVVFFYKTVSLYTSRGVALFFSVFWALHFTTYELLPNINPETLTMLVVTLLAWFVCRAFKGMPATWIDRNVVMAGILLGYLVLIKVIFSYVLVFLAALTLAGLLIGRNKKMQWRAVFIILIAYGLTLPYLVYTYNFTGRFYYWANSGGMSLYWMSTPYEHEYGDWQSVTFSKGFKGRNTEAIRMNHEADYADVRQQVGGVEMDDRFKELAIENIKANPGKYLVNCVANINRLFFGFPNSYQYENLKFFKMFPNIFLVVFIFFSIAVTLFNLRRIPMEMWFLLSLVFLYLGASTLVSAFPRMLLVIVPVLLFWTAFCVDRTITFKLIFPSDKA